MNSERDRNRLGKIERCLRGAYEKSMTFDVWLAFAVTSFAILIIPGPTILTVISYSLAHGRRAYSPLVGAIALGDSTAMALSLVGLGALLSTSSFWFTVVKFLGGLYLIFLGIRFLRAGASSTAVAATAPEMSRRKLFTNTYFVAALNPKGIIFYVAFFPQFIDPLASISVQLWLLALTFLGLGVLNTTFYAAFSTSAHRLLSTHRAQRRFNMAGGSLLTTAGLYTLFSRQTT